ncbi:MAG: prolipoprotein diacylglyceryl transferase [Candidatus Moranbacteria bacterium]|nr:prolipoprotein diacylglyceryl transferase [Candidatus Moranbacteria bacterium]
MDFLGSFWQHLPEQIHPIAFTVGFFSVHWYALCWLTGFFFALLLVIRYRKKFCPGLSEEDAVDLLLFLFLGAFIGGHLGYAFFYRPDIFLADPIGYFVPYHFATGWSGISGMSFHGGLIGVVLALLFFVTKRKLNFLAVADLVSFVAPVALFFGRIGNFLAGELYGRMTDVSLGMYFPGAPGGYALRHPSALYEALGEGLVLWGILLLVTRYQKFPGEVSAWFLIGYSCVRFLVEYVREPDRGVALLYDVLTRGQVLSVLVFVGGLGWFIWLQRKNRAKIVG